MKVVLAVDGGNSKTDVALVRDDGTLLAARRGPTTSHQALDLPAAMSRLRDLVGATVVDAGRGALTPDIGVFTLAGADTRADLRLLEVALADAALARTIVLRNDAQGALRAGTDRGWGVVVICGSGVGAAGVSPTGRSARLAALGPISGDWGGGTDVGWAGLAAAVRARDGRGPATSLATAVPRHFGRRTPAALTAALYAGRVAERQIGELSPVVFEAASAGDVVARAIVDRLADEVVAMGGAMLRRLHLTRRDPDVVLAGGIFRTTDAAFHERVRHGLTAIAPRARVVPLAAPPVAGAALLGLDAVGRVGLGERVRAGLAAWDRGLGDMGTMHRIRRLG